MFRVLHTSDWHIGKTLFSKKRYAEFSQFLTWLLGIIEQESIDILLVSGDIFDTTTPSNKALELYYSFLAAVSRTSCRQIVVTGGNHDSPTSLDAPKELLSSLRISVVGAARQELCEEIIVVKNVLGQELVVCAVPYLRERDVRVVEAGQSLEEKAAAIKNGVREHYQQVVAAALAQKAVTAPLIVMGHLFAARAVSVGDDSERELYVGTLAHIDIEELPQGVDYYAFGHLHLPQKVGGSEYKRYSGAPLPLTFKEAKKSKSVIVAEFDGAGIEPRVHELEVPVFQRLLSITGELEQILGMLHGLVASQESVWVEVEYTGLELCSELKERVEEVVQDSKVEVCRIRNPRSLELSLQEMAQGSDIELAELEPDYVFELCLQANGVDSVQAEEFRAMYKGILLEINEADVNAI